VPITLKDALSAKKFGVDSELKDVIIVQFSQNYAPARYDRLIHTLNRRSFDRRRELKSGMESGLVDKGGMTALETTYRVWNSMLIPLENSTDMLAALHTQTKLMVGELPHLFATMLGRAI
jgi:hypothetical protein